jgi:hypothetical protein
MLDQPTLEIVEHGLLHGFRAIVVVRVLSCNRNKVIDSPVHVTCQPGQITNAAVMGQIYRFWLQGHDPIDSLVRLGWVEMYRRRRWKYELPVPGVEFPV